MARYPPGMRPFPPRASVAPAIVVAAVLVVACGASSGSSTGSLSGETIHKATGHAKVTVEAVDNAFEPKFTSVSKGTTVTFDNAGHNKHNVISVGDGVRRHARRSLRTR